VILALKIEFLEIARKEERLEKDISVSGFSVLFCCFVLYYTFPRFEVLVLLHVNPLGCNKRTVKNQQNKS